MAEPAENWQPVVDQPAAAANDDWKPVAEDWQPVIGAPPKEGKGLVPSSSGFVIPPDILAAGATGFESAFEGTTEEFKKYSEWLSTADMNPYLRTIAQGGGAAIDLATRTIQGVFQGASAAAGAAYVHAGGNEAWGARLTRDLLAAAQVSSPELADAGMIKAIEPTIREFQTGVIDPGIRKTAQDIAERPAPTASKEGAAPHPLQALYDHLQTLDEAKQFNILEPSASSVTETPLTETPAQAALRAYPVGAQVTPEEGLTGYAKAASDYDAIGKEWVAKIDMPEDARDAIENIASAYNYFPEARAGKASVNAVAAVSEAAGLDPSEINADYFSQHFDNDAKVRATIQSLQQATRDFMDASKKVAADPTEENAVAALEAQERHRYVLEYVLGKRAESGRSLNTWKELLRETEHAKAVTEITKQETEGKLPAGVGDLLNATREVSRNISGGQPEAKVGLQKLIDAAENLVGAKPKVGEPATPLPPDVAGLVGEAKKALTGLRKRAQESAPEKGAAELEAFQKELENLGSGSGSLADTSDAAQKLLEAVKKEEEPKEPKAPTARGRLLGMARKLIEAQRGKEKAARFTNPEMDKLAETTRVAAGFLKQGRVRDEANAFRQAVEDFKNTGSLDDLRQKSQKLLDALGEQDRKQLEPKALVEIDKITAQARKFVAEGAEGAKAVLPPDIASLIDQSQKAISEAKKSQKTELQRVVDAAERQVQNALKGKRPRKPVEVLPPEWQALVDKADLVTKRFGGVAKGEQAAFILARAGRTPEEQAALARQVEGLTPAQVARVLDRVRKDSRPGWLFWGVQQGLISGLITHTKYAIVNTASTLTDRIIAPELAALIDRARGGDASLMAPLRAFPAMFGAVPDAFAGTVQAFKTGTRVPLESELKLAERGEKNPEAAGAQVPYGTQYGPNWGIWRKVFNDEQLDKAARVLGTPGRSANSLHTFYKILNERMSASSSAFEAAIKEGEKFGTDSFAAKYQYHLDNPTDQVLRQRVEDGYSGTFMEELGKQSKEISRFIRNTPFKWVVFFTHIPLNMARRSIEYSPLALLNTLGETKMGAAIKGELGDHAQNLALAKMTVGTAVGTYFIHKALNGQATGSYPADPKERRRWQMLGIQPNSIAANGQWFNIDRLGPQATVARIAANYAYVIQHYDGSQDDAMMKAGLALVLGTTKALSDDVGFQTIANIVNVLENPQEAARFAAWQLSSYMMPVSLVTQFASALDPDMRRADSLVKGLMYHLPGVRQELLPKRDPVYGEPVPNPGYHALVRESPISTDPIKAEMARVGYFPTPPRKEIAGVKLDEKQYDEYEATAGPLVKQLLQRWAPSLQGRPDGVKAKEFAILVQAGRAQARAAMQAHHPELWQQARENKRIQVFGQP